MNLLLGPDSEQMNNIRIQLGEDQDRFENNLKLLKKWIASQPHLPQNYDEEILYVFSRGCKHSLERTKKKIELYFIARSSYPELFANRDPTSQEIGDIAQTINVLPLSKLTPEGHRVTLMGFRSSDPSDFDIKSCLKLAYMVADIRVLKESPIAGDIFVYDFKGFTAEHFAKFVAPLFVKAVTLAHTTYPQRLHAVHVVNVPTVGEKLMQFIKSLIKEKLRDRFLLHKTPETLLKYIPKDVLPPEYHGTGDDMETLRSKWSKCLLDHADWFKKQENVKATGTVPNNLLHACGREDTFGIQGSFRQLAID